MARTYTQEEIAEMTGALKEMAMEVDAIEAQEEKEAAEALAQLNQSAPSQEAAPEQSQPQKTEPTQQQSANQATSEPVKDVDYWKKLAEEKAKELDDKEKEAESWKKRKADADRHLTPVQQENATLKAEVKELTAQLKELMVHVNAARQQQPVDYEEQEFQESFPDIAKRLDRVRQEADAKVAAMKKELDDLRAMRQDFDTVKSHLTQSREEALQHQHFAAIKAEHPDAELFFNSVLGPALVAWADSTQPEVIAQAIRKPMSVSGRDYARFITMFKRDSGMTSEGKKPTLADTVVRAASNTVVAPVNDSAPSGLLSDYEFENINTLLNNTRDHRKIEELMDRFEKTFDYKNKRK